MRAAPINEALAMGNGLDDDAHLVYGPLDIDVGGYTATVNGRDVPLTATEFRLLVELAGHPNRVMRHDELAERLGRRNAWEGQGTNTVRVHVAHLRAKLHSAGCDCIGTVYHVGYRFTPPQMTDEVVGGTVRRA